MAPLPCTHLSLPGIPLVRSGKVREMFDLGDAYLLVATDRVSAFDCILPNGIPHKGRVLTQISIFWFDLLQEIIPNHLLATDFEDFPASLQPHREVLEGRSLLVEKVEILPFECVARGYLAGSGWKEYSETGEVVGIRLREGYRQSDALDQPLFTPATKAESGHDINIDFATLAEALGTEKAERLRDVTLRLYTTAAAYARERGILIADTKFEFGEDAEGRLVLADEILTPDSSRFWPQDHYVPGGSPPSFDKQPVRDYLEGLAWDKTPPAPPLPDAVVEQTTARYLEAYRKITGQELPR